ncbi:MAG TPA: ParB N-terminal domain-containing protein [Actinomycetota bacterium]|nr:ParB N-terminal domain-containing protein [Actinomycetota bacterium]
MRSDPFFHSTFPRARRREAYRRLLRVLRRGAPEPLLELDEVSRRLRVFEQTYLGVRPIAVDRIVGTVSRSSDFDRTFLPQRRDSEPRWRRVEELYAEGSFPPIQVYEVDGRYFLVDGHHRVAIARQRGVDYIDADVTRLRTRYPLPANADVGRIIMAEQERVFLEESGLERARPAATIAFTRPQGYVELLEQIQIHGFHLMRERGEVLAIEDIAGDWYDRIYLPGVELIRAEALHELFPGFTDADRYLWVAQHRRELYPESSGTVGFDDVVRQARAEGARRIAGPARRRGDGSRPSSPAR